MAEAPLRKEDIIYHWCKGEGRYTTMGPHLARIYVAMYYDDTPLLSLSNFCQLTDPIRFDWCMYLLHGIRNNTVRVAKARADELAELYKISLAAHKDEPKLSVSSSVVATVDSSRANKPALELELEPTTPGRRAAASPRVVSSAPSISQPMRSERVMAQEPEPLPDPVFSSGARKASSAAPEVPPTITPTAAIAAATADNTPSSSQRPATRKPVAAEVLDDPQPLDNRHHSNTLKPQQVQAISLEELEQSRRLSSVHATVSEWWEHEQNRTHKPLLQSSNDDDSDMDSATRMLLGHLRTYNRPYIEHLKRYAKAGWSEANIALTLQRYYEQMANRERDQWPLETRALVECTLAEVDWEGIVQRI